MNKYKQQVRPQMRVDFEKKVRDIHDTAGMVAAVRYYRMEAHVSLKEAKDGVDKLLQKPI